MSETSSNRDLKNYRSRLKERGLARFTVLGLATDRELIRSLARRLAVNDLESIRIRATVANAITGETSAKGGILAALLLSPLDGDDLDFTREVTHGRTVDL